MRSPRVAGSGSAAASRSRGATSTSRTRIRSFESSPSRCRSLRISTNSAPRPYLKVTRLQSIQRGTALRGPAVVLGELRVAELLARELEGPLGVRRRERQRHVEVGAARLEGCGEEGRVEAGVARVQERVGAALAGERGDRACVA